MPSFPSWPGRMAMPGGRTPLRRRIRQVRKVYLYKISGFTRDSTGAILPDCTVKLFRKSDDVLLQTGLSGADGFYSFSVQDKNATYYVTAYRAGSPVLAGIVVDLTV